MGLINKILGRKEYMTLGVDVGLPKPQERELYIEAVPRKPPAQAPAKDTPSTTKRDEGKGKKESLLRRVAKNMREGEAWKQKHVVGYKPMNLLPGSRQEKPRQAPPSKKAKYKKKIQRIETRSSPPMNPTSIFGDDIFGNGKRKKPRSIFD